MTKTKADIINEIVNRTGVSRREASVVLSSFIDVVHDMLKDDHRIEIRGLGVFKNKHRKQRVARNPRKNIAIEVPARVVPTFKPSRVLKDIVSKSVEPKE